MDHLLSREKSASRKRASKVEADSLEYLFSFERLRKMIRERMIGEVFLFFEKRISKEGKKESL